MKPTDVLLYGSALFSPTPRDLNVLYFGDRDTAEQCAREWAVDFLGPLGASLPLDLHAAVSGEPFAVPCVPGGTAPYLVLAGARPATVVEHRTLSAWLRAPLPPAEVMQGLREGQRRDRLWSLMCGPTPKAETFWENPHGLAALRRAWAHCHNAPELRNLDPTLLDLLATVLMYEDRHLPSPLRADSSRLPPPVFVFTTTGSRRTIGRRDTPIRWELGEFTKLLRGEPATPLEPYEKVRLATIRQWRACGWRAPEDLVWDPVPLPVPLLVRFCEALGATFKTEWMVPGDFAASWARLLAENFDHARELRCLALREESSWRSRCTAAEMAEADFFWEPTEVRRTAALRALWSTFSRSMCDARIREYRTRWRALGGAALPPTPCPFPLVEGIELPDDVDADDPYLRLRVAVRWASHADAVALRDGLVPVTTTLDELARRWGPTLDETCYEITLMALNPGQPGMRVMPVRATYHVPIEEYDVQVWSFVGVLPEDPKIHRHVAWRETVVRQRKNAPVA